MSTNKKERASAPLVAVKALGGAILCMAWAIVQAQVQSQAPGKTNVIKNQSIGDFIAPTAPPMRTTLPMVSSSASPDTPLPAELIGGFSAIRKARPKNIDSDLGDLHLVGIFKSRLQAIAEFNIDGQVRFLETREHIKDQWIIVAIEPQFVELERCLPKPPCNRQRIYLEVQ